MYPENNKLLINEDKDDINVRKIHHAQALEEALYKFNAAPIKIPIAFSSRN